MTQGFVEQSELLRLSAGHERLMQVLAERLDDGMLEEIAAADYMMDYDAHLAALRSIRARDPPEGPMAWEPKEVLELFRWSELGDDRSGRRDRTREEFHLMRAFCCAALLEAFAEPANHDYFDGTNATVIQMLESLEVLGTDCEGHVAPFLAWLLIRLPDNENERGFYILALIWALLRSGAAQREASVISNLIDWMIDDEATVRRQWHGGAGQLPERWLFGTTFFNLRFAKWEQLGIRLSVEAEGVQDPRLREKLDDIALRVVNV